MTSLTQLRTLTRQQYRFDPNGRVFSDSELDQYLQQSYKHVQTEMWMLLEAKEDISVVAGTQEYTLPTTLFTINDDGVTIGTTPLILSDYLDTAWLTQQSKPTRYYLRETDTGTKIGFVDIPDGSYTVSVFYKGYRADLSTSQASTLPTQFDMLVALYSAYLAESTLRGNTQNAINKLQAYNLEKAHLGKTRYKRTITFSTKR